MGVLPSGCDTKNEEADQPLNNADRYRIGQFTFEPLTGNPHMGVRTRLIAANRAM
jgi:hypothetical protein